MAFQAGSLPWLVAHEVRLGWRAFRGKQAVIAGIFALLLAFVVLFIVRSSRFQQNLNQFVAGDTLPNWAVWLSLEIVVLLLAVSLIQSLRAGTNALFDRGDLDLLLASPVSGKVVFASRLIGIAINGFLGLCAFLIIPAGLLIGFGLTRLWGIFPTMMALSLLGSSIGVLVILLLVKLVGVKRTRSLAALAVVPFMLATQLLGRQGDRLSQWVERYPVLGVDSALWRPARAILGDWLGLLLLWAIAGGVAWLTVGVLHGWFVAGTQESQRSQTRTRPSESESAPKFSSGLSRLMVLKEWRLIRRNPDLLSQMMVSFIMLFPFLGSVLQSQDNDAFFAYITLGMIGVIAISLTDGVANLAICGEEAPALLQASPASGAHIRRLKLVAVLLPVWGVMLPLVALLAFRGYSPVGSFSIMLGASVSAALLRLWNGAFVPAAAMKKRQRHPSRDPVLSVLEWLNYVAWFVLGIVLQLAIVRAILIVLGILGGLMAIAHLRNRALGPALFL